MDAVLIEFTPEQYEIVSPIVMRLKEGEAMVAQVYVDGFRMIPLDKQAAERVRIAIGSSPPGIGRRYVSEDAEPLQGQQS